jgi:TAT (twin-arginine translocation) pathway signal sequence
MMDVSRRHFLAGAAAAGAASTLAPFGAPAARAAVPPAGAQAPGFYRYKVGSYECTSINDGARSFPMPDTFVKNVPKEEALAAAEAAYAGNPPQVLRHGVGREGDGGGIPLHLPVDRSCRERRREISAGADSLESADLILMARIDRARPSSWGGLAAAPLRATAAGQKLSVSAALNPIHALASFCRCG